MVRSAFIISDIHLGASNGLLTAIDYNAQTGETFRRPLAETLLDMLLADLKEYCLDNPVEQCILLGDIFEFSFAPYGLAMQNGRWFFQKLVDSGLFETFVYIPGNHDHHLWQQVIEDYYLMSALESPPLEYPRTLPASMTLSHTFLDSLLPENYGFQITYPNYEMQVNNTWFFMHHGHYLQKLYIAASNLLAQTIQTDDIEDLELLNAPFLEFGWYNLGQAYNIGQHKLVDQLYFMYKTGNTEKIDQLLQLFLKKIDAWSRARSPRRWNPFGMLLDSFTKWVGPYLLKRLLFKHTRAFSRHQHASSTRHQRLSQSLDTAVMNYVQKYLMPDKPGCKDCTFIFGHTHEPEENYLCYDPKQVCYRIYNTGGWVVDSVQSDNRFVLPKMAPIYIAEDGSVNPLHFTDKHQDFLVQELENDKILLKMKQDLMVR